MCVGQRALKLPAVKVGGLKKKSASRPQPHPNQSAWVRVLDAVESFSKFVCLFVCNRGDSFMSQDGLRTRKLCQSPMPDHCCNSGIIRGASPRCFPYTITRLLLKSQHVMRDTALEFGPPSGTGKLIPLLLDAGTSSCTRLPPPTDGIFPHLAHSHTCFTAQV